ncbi:MAG: M50 family metallopeptidase [Peptococcaceae bacterium]
MEIILLIIKALICYFIVTTLHEMGHIVIGLLSGFRFELFVIGPVGLKRNNYGKVVPYIEKNTAMWGGAGATVPINYHDDNIKRFANILIGGPLTSLIFGLIILILNFHLQNKFLFLLGVMAVSISIATLIPIRAGSFYSDGGRWLRIKQGGYPAKAEIAIIEFMQSYFANKTYGKINIDHTKYLIKDKDPRNRYLGHYFAYKYYKENKQIEKAMEEQKALSTLAGEVPKNFVRLIREE